MKWEELSMADRAKYIKIGVSNGITSLSAIRDSYNKYDKGGPVQGGTSVRNVKTGEIEHFATRQEAEDYIDANDYSYYQGELPELVVTAPKSKKKYFFITAIPRCLWLG